MLSPAPSLRIGPLRIGLLRIGLMRIGLMRIGLLRIGLTRIGLLMIGLWRIGLWRMGLLRTGLLPCGCSLLLPVPSVIGVAVIIFMEAVAPLGTLGLLLVAHIAEALQRIISAFSLDVNPF